MACLAARHTLCDRESAIPLRFQAGLGGERKGDMVKNTMITNARIALNELDTQLTATTANLHRVLGRDRLRLHLCVYSACSCEDHDTL